jgi:alpha-L-rhamnosidase
MLMAKRKISSQRKIFQQSQWIAMPDNIGSLASKKGRRKDSRKKNPELNHAPMFRHEFNISDSVVSATMNICGLGYYEASINNQRVGDHVLDPAQTDYEERVFYVSYDTMEYLTTGKNCIGVMLGNGWYNQDRVWGKKGFSYGQPKLICELHITLVNGNKIIIGSNGSWKCAPGPVTDNNVYAGECYNANLEHLGWDTINFDDSAWTNAVLASSPGGKMELQEMPPIRKIEDIQPINITLIGEGQYIVDMGQNFSGWARIQVNTDAGVEIRLRFAETIDIEGNIDTASTGLFATKVEQIDCYITKGTGVEIWEPRFTYHGFRFVEVSGWPGDLSVENIIGVVVHTDLHLAGEFECSDERLNQLHRMVLWTHRSNIHGIPEDCPARERCGWLGDANMIAEFSMWNYQAKIFWEKYLGDIETTRSTNKGIPCNIAPGKRGEKSNANPDWAATLIMLPWYIYVQYGDSKVLNNHWKGMTTLMKYYKKSAKKWIITRGYGDWFDPGHISICTHTPPSLTSTFWFYRCAIVMKAAAKVLKISSKAEEYTNWAHRIKDSAIHKFFDPESGSFGSQTANSMALEFGIVPKGENSRILKALVTDIKERNIHLSTGIMGVRFLFEVLTRHNYGDLALALMHQNSYPSFGDLISRGATTLWECWGEKEHDKQHGARSLNHPMMGGYDNWFYNTLAGIRPDPTNPGFKHFFLAPHPISGLKWTRTYYNCPFGRITSDWSVSDGVLEWTIEVPQGTTATVSLPFTQQTKHLKPGQHKLKDIQK